MQGPPLEVADLVCVAGQGLLVHSRKWLRGQHLKVLSAIARCRYSRARRSSPALRRLRPFPAPRLQLVLGSALSQVSGRHPQALARGSPQRAAACALSARRLHIAASPLAARPAEPKAALLAAAASERPDVARSRSRSSPARRRERLPLDPAYLESNAPNLTLIPTLSFPPAASRSTAAAGSTRRARTSSCPSGSWRKSFAASSSTLSRRPSLRASCVFHGRFAPLNREREFKAL